VKVRDKLTDWRALASRHVAQTRQILRKLLAGPLLCAPIRTEERVGFSFEAQVSLGRLIGGAIDLPTKLACPEGFEPAFQP
jgi:hypothetical protein